MSLAPEYIELSLAPRVRPRLRLSIAPGHCRTTISPQDSFSSPQSKRRHYCTTSYIWSDLYSNAKIAQQEAEPKTPNNMSINPAETPPLGQGQDTNPRAAIVTVHPTVYHGKFTEELPKLTERNFVQWKAALEDILTEHELNPIITPGFTMQPEPSTADNSFYHKAFPSCRRMITASLETEISDLLPVTLYSETPANIVTYLQDLLQVSYISQHAILQKEARSIKLIGDLSIKYYVHKHRTHRARMIAAEYPHILHESTTVKFMAEGLRENPSFSDMIRTFKAAGYPASISALHDRLLDIEDENDKTNLIPQPTPIRPNYHGLAGRGRGGRPGYRRGRVRGRGRYGQPWQPHRHGLTNQLDQIAQVGKLLTAFNNPQNKPIPPSRRPNLRPTQAHSATTADQHDEQEPLLDLAALQALRAAAETDMQNIQQDNSDRTYILDSGANPSHINHPITEIKTLTHPLQTITTTSSSGGAKNSGIAKIKTTRGYNLSLPAVVHPLVQPNFLSVHDIADQWGHVVFSKSKAHIVHLKARRPVVMGTAQFSRGQYQLAHQATPVSLSARTTPRKTTRKPRSPSPSTPIAQSQSTRKAIKAIPRTAQFLATGDKTHSKRTPRLPNDFPHPPSKSDAKTVAFHLWHLVFNHVNLRTLKMVALEELLPLLDILKKSPPKLTWSSCANGKLRPQPHKTTAHKYEIGIAISSDVCGPIAPKSIHGNSYFVSFIDTK